MQTIVKKWGDSLAIHIPNQILESLRLEEKSILKITLQENKIILEKSTDLHALCEAITEDNLNIDPQWNTPSVDKEW